MDDTCNDDIGRLHVRSASVCIASTAHWICKWMYCNHFQSIGYTENRHSPINVCQRVCSKTIHINGAQIQYRFNTLTANSTVTCTMQCTVVHYLDSHMTQTESCQWYSLCLIASSLSSSERSSSSRGIC